jgi:hypothetical protein
VAVRTANLQCWFKMETNQYKARDIPLKQTLYSVACTNTWSVCPRSTILSSWVVKSQIRIVMS